MLIARFELNDTSIGGLMRSILAPLLLVAASSVQAQTASYDAVAAAPQSHRILFEDEKVRVLRVEVKPGATEPVHEHRWPCVMYFEQPQPITYIEYKLLNGRAVETRRADAPALQPSQTVKGTPEGLHAVMNRGTAAFIAVRVEFKDGSSASK
jgi:hypothetical protein